MPNDWMEKYRQEERERAAKGREHLLSLIPALKEKGAAKLVTHYDGSGDSGEIQYIVAFVDESASHEGWYSGADIPGSVDMGWSDKEKEQIDSAVCDVLAGQDIDWYNNEGGFGYVVLNVATGKIKIENNRRIEDSVYDEQEL